MHEAMSNLAIKQDTRKFFKLINDDILSRIPACDFLTTKASVSGLADPATISFSNYVQSFRSKRDRLIVLDE